MGCLDSWCGSLVMFFTGYLSIAEQASWMISFDIMVLLFVTCTGLSKACCTIVGQYIGSGQIQEAKTYFHTFNILGLILIAILNFLQYTFFIELISVYTSIPEVQIQSINIRFLFIIHTIPDLLKGLFSGTIKALGI